MSPETFEHDLVRLQHMLDATSKILDYTDNCVREDLDNDEKLALALVRLLEILGEAAKNISEPAKRKYPHIPWRQIADARNRLIHGYFDIDLNVVWQIVSTDIPTLNTQLKTIIADF
jgi:uncharacterized protein with HEPN domain